MMALEEQNDRPGGTMSDETADETADETKDVPEDGRNGEAHGVRRRTVAVIVAVVSLMDLAPLSGLNSLTGFCITFSVSLRGFTRLIANPQDS